MGSETAVFAGGCFWCTEAVLQRLKGVTSVIPGYTGGHTENPTYEAVCDETTGHVEAVQVTFDPAIISFETLLSVFFATHDPGSLNRQGGDVGTQYRSAVFYVNDEQRRAVEGFIARLQAEGASIVTEVEPLTVFYDAEGYHKDYYNRNTGVGYCQVVINPKLAKLREDFAHLLS